VPFATSVIISNQAFSDGREATLKAHLAVIIVAHKQNSDKHWDGGGQAKACRCEGASVALK